MSNRYRLALDAALFAVVLALANPGLTGFSVHEWLGLALLAPVLVHLTLNWQWVLHVTERIFDRTNDQSRLHYLADVGLYVSVVTVSVSGIVVWPGVAESLGLARYSWHLLHSASADTTVLFTLVHAALHWRWIVGVLGRLVPRPTAMIDSTERTYR